MAGDTAMISRAVRLCADAVHERSGAVSDREHRQGAHNARDAGRLRNSHLPEIRRGAGKLSDIHLRRKHHRLLDSDNGGRRKVRHDTERAERPRNVDVRPEYYDRASRAKPRATTIRSPCSTSFSTA